MRKKFLFYTGEPEPWLPNREYEIVSWYKNQPVIIDNTGFRIRLDKKKDYKFINQ